MDRTNLNLLPPLLKHELPKVREIFQLKDVIDAMGPGKLICVSFIASWSEQCRQISSKFLETMFTFDQVVFVPIDVDQCRGFHEALNVTMVPTFVLVRNREILEIFVGNSYPRLLRRLQMQFEEGPRDELDVNRVRKLLKDEVYMLDLTKVARRNPRLIEKLELRFANRRLLWDSEVANFIGAFNRLQKQGVIPTHVGEEELDETTPKRHESFTSGETVQRRSSMTFGERSSELDIQSESSSEEESISEKIRNVCRDDFEIEDRLYSPDEVKDLLIMCEIKCYQQREAESRRTSVETQESITQPEIYEDDLIESSDEETTRDFRGSLIKNMERIALARDLKKKDLQEKERKKHMRDSTGSYPTGKATAVGKANRSRTSSK